MKPATYDSSKSWLDYMAHFQAWAELNNWTDTEKVLKLSLLLRGQAQKVFWNTGSSSKDYMYYTLAKALEERFWPMKQLSRVQLIDQRQKASQSMAELGQDIRRLTNHGGCSTEKSPLKSAVGATGKWPVVVKLNWGYLPESYFSIYVILVTNRACHSAWYKIFIKMNYI